MTNGHPAKMNGRPTIGIRGAHVTLQITGPYRRSAQQGAKMPLRRLLQETILHRVALCIASDMSSKAEIPGQQRK